MKSVFESAFQGVLQGFEASFGFFEETSDEEGGPGYATLAREGPKESSGSVGHPDGCTPCTFYCFTRRGCNRAAECKPLESVDLFIRYSLSIHLLSIHLLLVLLVCLAVYLLFLY